MRPQWDEELGMKPQHKARIPFIVGFVVVLIVAVGGVYFVSTLPGIPSSLPVPAGTTFALEQGSGLYFAGAYGRLFPIVLDSTKAYRVTGAWRSSVPTDVRLTLECTGYCGGGPYGPPSPDTPMRGTFAAWVYLNISNPAQNRTFFMSFLSVSPGYVTITQTFALVETAASAYPCPPGYWAC